MQPPHPHLSRRLGALALVAWLAGAAAGRGDDGPAAGPGAEPGSDAPLRAMGRYVYQQHCQTCHGRHGRGDGELAKGWDVPPRNFRLARFKYRSTPAGALPTDADLGRTIRHGISGTAMPAFRELREDEVRAVIAHLKTLSPAWRDPARQAAPVPQPPRPAWFDDPPLRQEHARAGRARFQQLCAACHGEGGGGDGPAAPTLRDEEERPIRPADLRQPRRSGDRPEDACRTILTGITGTPMAGFAEALGAAEVWQVVAWLTELRGQGEPPPAGRAE